MRVPEHKIDEIRLQANIVDVISSYVPLRKRGKNFIGSCPFHNEKTPSFTVSEEKQIYKCFGCSAGGNVFTFIMEYKNISFIESVQEIAESIGIELNVEEQQNSEEQSEQELLYDINVAAAKYFSNNLLSSKDGEAARDYLKKRNIKPQTQRVFGLGFAFGEWENFVNYAKSENIDLSQAHQLGLIDTRDNGGYYDKYRNRIIYPIFSPNGRVIAFGGRRLDDTEKSAKYLNSPESIIYHKRRSLYGLYHSKDEIRKLDKALLVEGYMDTIALFQHGVKNVVASSGTSLTDEQVQLLSRYTKNITLLFDADAAGQAASVRSIEILLKQDFDVKIASFPEGDDPDSYINKFGKSEFENQINNAKNFLEYQSASYKEKGMFEDPAQSTNAIRELVKSASLVKDELKRNLLIKSIAKKFALREKVLESELEKLISNGKQQEARYSRKENYSRSETLNERQEPREENENKFELEVVKLIFEGISEILDNIFDNILPDDFENPNYRKLAQLVYDSYLKDEIATNKLIDKIEDQQLKNFVLNLVLNEEQISYRHGEEYTSNEVRKDNLIKNSHDVALKFKIIQLNQQIDSNRKMIASSSSDSEIIEVLGLINELEAEKKMIIAQYNEAHSEFNEEEE